MCPAGQYRARRTGLADGREVVLRGAGNFPRCRMGRWMKVGDAGLGGRVPSMAWVTGGPLNSVHRRRAVWANELSPGRTGTALQLGAFHRVVSYGWQPGTGCRRRLPEQLS